MKIFSKVKYRFIMFQIYLNIYNFQDKKYNFEYIKPTFRTLFLKMSIIVEIREFIGKII